MATYSIKAPNGQTYEIDGPEGATQEQVQAEVMRQFPDAAGGADAAPPPISEEDGLVAPTVHDESPPTDDSALTGFLAGVAKPFIKGGQFLSNIPVIGPLGDQLSTFTGAPTSDEEMAQNERVRANNSRTGWQTAGTIAGTLPTLALPGGGLVQGAAAGALSSDANDFGGVAKDALIGGALGRAGDAVAGVIAPKANQYLATLRDAGVRVTTGDIAGQGGTIGGMVKSLEDIGARTPIAGATMRKAQERGVLDLNRAAINRSLKPIGEALPDSKGAGHDAIAFAADRLKAAYGDVLPRLRGTLDRAFERRISAIDARAEVPAEYASKLEAVKTDLKNAFQRAGPNGAYSGRTLRDASEKLGDVASAWRASGDPYERRIGEVAQQYRDQLHALARRQNPEFAKRLRDVDTGYASLVRVERAALSSPDGVFTPAQYRAATRMTDRSARKSAYARGRALDQDLAKAADIVMTNRAAMGGSKDINSLITLGVGGLGAASGNPYAIGAGAGLLAGNIGYTRPVQAAARWALTRNPSAAEDYISQIVRYGNRAVSPSVAATISSLPD